MNRRVVLTIMGFVLLGMQEGGAQSYAEEALLVSRIRPGGSARIQAMGGVQNALGGDISSAYYNPAGLGMFNRSEASITPAMAITTYSSGYLGNTNSETRNNLIIPNLGIAFHAGQDGQKGFWGGTLGINFNRINDFNETFSYGGTNPDNSIIDYFINDAYGTNTSQFNSSGSNYNTPTWLGYNNFLVGPQDILVPPGPDSLYFTDVTGIPYQNEVVKNSGAQNQWSLSYGVNFNDKIFVGGGIGITSFSYKSEKTYQETFSDPGQPMSAMQLKETLTLEGNGINATAGVIYKPIAEFQMGFSVATPTSYEIDDNYLASMSTSWKNFVYQPGDTLNNESATTDNLAATYGLATPWRLSFGLTYFFQKHGFLSADAEWLNYNKTRYDSDDYSTHNDQIKNLYKSTFNIRVGGEYRLNNYRFRAGYSLMPDPFQTQQRGVDRGISSLSTGVGYRTSKFYVDLAVIFTSGAMSYNPYPLYTPQEPVVTQTKKTTSILITVGIPF